MSGLAVKDLKLRSRPTRRADASFGLSSRCASISSSPRAGQLTTDREFISARYFDSASSTFTHFQIKSFLQIINSLYLPSHSLRLSLFIQLFSSKMHFNTKVLSAFALLSPLAINLAIADNWPKRGLAANDDIPIWQVSLSSFPLVRGILPRTG